MTHHKVFRFLGKLEKIHWNSCWKCQWERSNCKALDVKGNLIWLVGFDCHNRDSVAQGQPYSYERSIQSPHLGPGCWPILKYFDQIVIKTLRQVRSSTGLTACLKVRLRASLDIFETGYPVCMYSSALTRIHSGAPAIFKSNDVAKPSCWSGPH